MEKQRAELIHEQVLIMAEAFGLPISEARQQIYVEALMDLPADSVKCGVARLIKTRTFAGNLPTVAEIREASCDGEPLESRAAIAWDKLMYALHRHGTYQSIAFDDKIIYHIVSQWGGWLTIGDWPAEETHWKRKDFIKLYEAYSKANVLPEPKNHLKGLAEIENDRAGFLDKIPAPIFITGSTGDFKSLPMPQHKEPERIAHEN